MFILYAIVLLLIPTVMIVFGLLWWKHPPKTINYNYGHRTTMSMKNQETWDFAHKHSGEIMRYAGMPLEIVTIAVLFIFRKSDDNTLGIMVLIVIAFQIVCLCLSTLLTEKALKENFDEDGIRKKFD